jgi:hypothetical protein
MPDYFDGAPVGIRAEVVDGAPTPAPGHPVVPSKGDAWDGLPAPEVFEGEARFMRTTPFLLTCRVCGRDREADAMWAADFIERHAECVARVVMLRITVPYDSTFEEALRDWKTVAAERGLRPIGEPYVWNYGHRELNPAGGWWVQGDGVQDSQTDTVRSV